MRIKWLHISDIHLNKTGTETRRMRMQLISYLKSAKVLYDYLFVTGDLRYAPMVFLILRLVHFCLML